MDDWAFYDKPRSGTAFTPEKLRRLFQSEYEIVSIEKYREDVPGTLQGAGFLWACLFRRK